ncbi:MAG: pseudouridine synthase [Burkholderiales bacterium]|nr:pseudouridine synthase [Burkholderiales bacterium]
MVTLKLKKPGERAAPKSEPARAPVRGAGAGVKARPTLAQAQAQRAEREARYQEQLRQRFGDRPPEAYARRGEPEAYARRGEPEAYARRGESAAPPAPKRRADVPASAPAAAPTTRTSNAAFSPRAGQRPPESSPPHRDPREAQRFDPRPAPRADPRMAPRFDPRAARRDETRSAPAGDPRATPRVDPRASQRGDPRPARPVDPRTARPTEARPMRGTDPRSAPPVGPRGEDRDNRRARYRPVVDDDDDFDPPAAHAPGSLRLSKRMSELGIASRREADEWIAKGWVRVDDQVVSELGSRVLPGQRITVDAKAKFQQAQRVTVLVNKPVGYVSGQAEDGYEPAVVLVTPANQWREDRSGTRFLREHLKSLVPAGRLDIDSVGLLVLTQDGRVAKQLVGEDSEIEKEYLVRVAMAGGAKLPESSLALLRHGLELDGEPLRPAQVEWVNEDQLRFVLTQGKKRQIRRMCEAVGLQVLGLKRVRIGGVMLGDLPAGQWRYLRADEAFG